MFYLMDAVPGRILIDAAMPDQTPAERAAIFDSMNDVLARLHKVDPAKVGLGDYGRTGQYIARQVARWSRQYAELKTEDIPAMDKLSAWLPEHIPAEDPTTIVHGDYRLGNLIVHPTEPRIVAVLDWELSTLGHPLCDLAYNCMGYHLTEPPHGFATVDFRQARPADRKRICRRLLPAGRPRPHRALELLRRLLAVPARRHRPGRLSPRPGGQFVQSGIGEDEQVGARARRARLESGRLESLLRDWEETQ